MLSPLLHQRYEQAAKRILSFWRESRQPPTTWEDFDVATGQWLEHIFSEGYPKGYGCDGLAALQHFLPELAGKLRHSWRLLKSWQKMEPPIRVLPISPLVVMAISGACVQMGMVDNAAAFLVAFDTMLRPGELYRLTKGDITWAGGKAVLRLHHTKSGQRRGADEMVVCGSHVANKWLAIALSSKRPTDSLLSCRPATLRELFFSLLEYLAVQGHFSLYSFRRGGATWHFLSEGSMERTLLRGRWVSSSTARIYLQDAAAGLSHLSLTPEQKQHMKHLAQVLSAKGQNGARGR